MVTMREALAKLDEYDVSGGRGWQHYVNEAIRAIVERLEPTF